jgi:hypothetical protein
MAPSWMVSFLSSRDSSCAKRLASSSFDGARWIRIAPRLLLGPHYGPKIARREGREACSANHFARQMAWPARPGAVGAASWASLVAFGAEWPLTGNASGASRPTPVDRIAKMLAMKRSFHACDKLTQIMDKTAEITGVPDDDEALRSLFIAPFRWHRR